MRIRLTDTKRLVGFYSDYSASGVLQAQRIESLWDGPHSLLKLCCFTIRDNMNNLSKHQIYQLGLPKTVEDSVMFHDVATTFF